MTYEKQLMEINEQGGLSGIKRVSMWVRLKYAAMNLKKLAMLRWKNNCSPMRKYKKV